MDRPWRETRILAWVLWTVAIATAIGSVVFLALGWSTPPPEGAFGFRGFGAIFAVVYGTVGALIASRHRRNPIGWLLLAGGVTSGFQELANQYAIYAVLERGGDLAMGEFAAWLPAWIWVPGTGLTMFVLLLFPGGHLPSPRWRWVVVIGMAGVALSSLGYALVPGPLENFGVLDNPFGTGPREAMRVTYAAGQILYGASIILAAISLVIRFRKSHGDERQQLKWLVFAGLFLSFSLFTSFVNVSVLPPGAETNFVVANIVIAGFVSLPVSMALAILKYRLYDIDLVISKTVVVGSLAVFITAVYVAVVVGVGAVIGNSGNAVLSAVAAAIVAIAFQPVRRGAQRLADRLVYGERATPYEVLSEFSERLSDAYSVDDVLPRMARLVAEGTGAEEVRVWLHDGARFRAAAAWPSSTGEDAEVATDAGLPGTAFEIRHQGELLGALTIAMPAADPMGPGQERLVADVASQAGLVVRNASLIADLKDSRRRLVTAQDHERRRIERNIHDGAQQQLVALSVKARLARSLASKDPARTEGLLEELQGDLTQAVEDLRDLARGIYPPLLADRGLGAALEAQSRKASVPVSVDVDGVGRYAPEVEASVYFCTLEALNNVAKHAEAGRATVRLADADGELRFEVEDDGHGFDAAAGGRGTGLQGMADRLGAVGGSIEVRSSPGHGTTVVGSIPIGDQGVKR